MSSCDQLQYTTAKRCVWERTVVLDEHGIRQEQRTCRTCGRTVWRTMQAPYLGDDADRRRER